MKYLSVLCFLSCLIQLQAEFRLTLLHTNDMHTHFDQDNKRSSTCMQEDVESDKCYAGVARMVTKVNEMRKLDPDALLLDGGDQYQGTIWFSLFKWEAPALFMQKLKYRAMSFGNHEFDNDISGLVPFLQNMSSPTFDVLSSNIDATDEPTLKDLFKKSIVVDIKGQKVGIIGYITEETPVLSKTGKLKFLDVVSSVRAEATKLKNSGVNKIIALGHAGFETDLRIAREVPEVDIVVGGHTNTFLYTGEPPSSEKAIDKYPVEVARSPGPRALVVQAYAFGKYLGFLNVTFDDKGDVQSYSGNPILLDKTVKPDNETQSKVNAMAAEIKQKYGEVIGVSLVELQVQDCRLKECNLGNLMADAALERYLKLEATNWWSNVSMALINGGALRTALSKGNITIGGAVSVAPFGNTMVMALLKGIAIRTVLEFSVQGYNTRDPSGKFLQVSGIRVVYDLSKPEGKRVQSVHVACTKCPFPEYVPLQDSEEYQVVLNQYVFYGGDGYTVKPYAIKDFVYGDLDTDLLLEYIKAKSPIKTGLENRIVILDANSGARNLAGGLIIILLALRLFSD